MPEDGIQPPPSFLYRAMVEESKVDYRKARVLNLAATLFAQAIAGVDPTLEPDIAKHAATAIARAEAFYLAAENRAPETLELLIVRFCDAVTRLTSFTPTRVGLPIEVYRRFVTELDPATLAGSTEEWSRYVNLRFGYASILVEREKP